MDYQPNTRFS